MTGASVQSSSPLPLTFRHRAGVSPYTSAFALAGTCVFVKQSPGPAHCAPHQLIKDSPAGGSLLPKLRDQFAEFLNEGSPVHLGVLTPAHLCRSAVRAPAPSLPRAFLGPEDQPDRLAYSAQLPHTSLPEGNCVLGGSNSNTAPGLPHSVPLRDLIICSGNGI